MGKPSIFSSDYEKRIKRRRVNMILFILVIISAAFFGAKYYLHKNDISLFKIKNPFKIAENKVQPNNKNQNLQKTPSAAPAKQNTQQSNPVQSQAVQNYQYKTADGKIYKIEYATKNGANDILGLKEDTVSVFFDISQDKKKIVFEDKSSGQIIIGDVSGHFTKISRDSYTTRSTGKVLTKEMITGANPWFVWAAKPHFTSDGRVVYVSHLPYIKVDGDLYLWVAAPDGSDHRKLGPLTNNINDISYGGYDSNGRLIIKSKTATYYLAPGSYELTD